MLAEEEVFLLASSASPERLFTSVGLVKCDLRDSLLDTTVIDVMWAKQAPQNQLEREQEEVNNHQDIHTIYNILAHGNICN